MKPQKMRKSARDVCAVCEGLPGIHGNIVSTIDSRHTRRQKHNVLKLACEHLGRRFNLSKMCFDAFDDFVWSN